MQSEFPFDGMDVQEDVDRVICYFGFHLEPSEEERQTLIRELLPLGIDTELKEVMRRMTDPI